MDAITIAAAEALIDAICASYTSNWDYWEYRASVRRRVYAAVRNELEREMTLAQEIVEAWSPDYSVSVSEMVWTRGGYCADGAPDQSEYDLPDGSVLIYRHPGADIEPDWVYAQ